MNRIDRRSWVVPVCLILGWSTVVESAQDWTVAQGVYETSAARIDAVANTEQKTQLEAYGQALTALLERCKVAGRLDDFLVVQKEIDRLNEAASLPSDVPSTWPPDLQQAQAQSQAAITAIQQDVTRRKVILTEQYIAHLQGTIRKLMQHDRIDDAKAANDEVKRMQDILTELRDGLPAEPSEAPAASPVQTVTPVRPMMPAFIDRDLVLHFPLDRMDRGRTPEASGKGRAATVHGAGVEQEGQVGGAFSFNGKAHIDAGRPKAQRGSLTIAVWIKTTDAGFQRMIVTRSRWQSGAWQLMTHHGKPAAEFSAGGMLVGETGVCDGQWHHIVAVYDAKANIRYLYVDGDLEGQDATKPPFRENDNDLYIGLRPGTDNYFEGLIDDVRIYGRALSSDEIRQLYDALR